MRTWCNTRARVAQTKKVKNPPYLPWRLDSLNHGEANYRPGNQQAHGHLPVESSTLRDAVGDVQGLAVPVVGGGRALLTLRHHIYGQKVTPQRCHLINMNCTVVQKPSKVSPWLYCGWSRWIGLLVCLIVSYMYWSCSWWVDTHATAEVAGRTGRNRRGSSWWWHCSRELRRSTPTDKRGKFTSDSQNKQWSCMDHLMR